MAELCVSFTLPKDPRTRVRGALDVFPCLSLRASSQIRNATHAAQPDPGFLGDRVDRGAMIKMRIVQKNCLGYFPNGAACFTTKSHG